ncbi:unnamed protein product, partial [marine sediment metagenome]
GAELLDGKNFIQNNGDLFGNFPFLQLLGQVPPTILLSNSETGTVHFEGNNDIQNTQILSSNHVSLIHQVGLSDNELIQVNLENVELDIDLPDDSILFTMEDNKYKELSQYIQQLKKNEIYIDIYNYNVLISIYKNNLYKAKLYLVMLTFIFYEIIFEI